MPGTIRIFIALTCLILAGSIDDSLPIGQMLMIAGALLAVAIPFAISGINAMNRNGGLD